MLTTGAALIIVVIALSIFGAASQSQAPGTPAQVSRVAARDAGPTKFARARPSDTTVPTRTATVEPSSTATRTALPTRSATLTLTRAATRTPRATATSSPALNRAALAPATSESAIVQTSTATPPATATVPPTPTHSATPTAQIIGAESLGGSTASCAPIPSENYEMLSENSDHANLQNDLPDLDLRLRSYVRTNAATTLIDYDGATDYRAPQLYDLFADHRTPKITSVYQVYDWDWDKHSRSDLISDPPVTLAGLEVAPGETIYTPDFGGNIGGGRVAMVLYASPGRMTLKYTREDNVKQGYTLHLEGICVEPRLLALYRDGDSGGRQLLPTLRPGQAIGRAIGSELGVAIRDNGAFMDPRSRKDWWIGR